MAESEKELKSLLMNMKVESEKVSVKLIFILFFLNFILFLNFT